MTTDLSLTGRRFTAFASDYGPVGRPELGQVLFATRNTYTGPATTWLSFGDSSVVLNPTPDMAAGTNVVVAPGEQIDSAGDCHRTAVGRVVVVRRLAGECVSVRLVAESDEQYFAAAEAAIQADRDSW